MICLYIFDIDGTLMSAGGAGTLAINKVFETHFGYENICQHLSFAGATDKNIFAKAQDIAAQASGKKVLSEAEIFLAYANNFEKELQKNNTCQAYDGVVELLEKLKTQKEAVVGIGTGNLQSTAQLKLKYAGLDTYFSFGGYGSDHEQRTDIFQTALSRGAAQLPHPPSRVVVFGDTPKDIWAAQDIRAEVVAVTTGTFDAEPLQRENPDMVVPALNVRAVFEFLGLCGT